jgi:hypothetical protein
MPFKPKFLTTHLGSIPHTESVEICDRLIHILDIPAWPQMSRRTFRENMYVQFSASLPAIVTDENKQKVYFDTRRDISSLLEAFYTSYLGNDLSAFALKPTYASGFFNMLEAMRRIPGEWAKGQVTGPISFGLTVTDQDLRASLYNEQLADVIVKNTAMIARWQVKQLRAVRSNVILFVDEPYMASFGSAFISLTRGQVIDMLNEVFDAIHAEGGLAGVHCCANTDWSVLLATKLDILNLDAYGFIENLALFPTELRAFLDRGGVVAWGIVPNNKEIYDITPEGIAHRLFAGFNLIHDKAQARGVTILPEEFASSSLVAPSCGLGPTTTEIADRVLDVVMKTGQILRQRS